MKRTIAPITLTLGLLLGAPCARGGPMEIHVIEQRIAATEQGIAEAEALLKRALASYADDAGEHGMRLRALKRERLTLARQLEAARREQAERQSRALSGSLARPVPSRP